MAIIGSRTTGKENFNTVLKTVQEILKNLNKNNDIIISGGAPTGADAAARYLAGRWGFSYLEAVAFWRPAGTKKTNDYDRLAGLKRNSLIAELADIVYAVWDGKSRGTADTIEKAKARGKTVIVVPL